MHHRLGIDFHVFRRPGIGILLEAHHHSDLGTQLLPIEGERLFAAAVEKQIGMDRHFFLLCYGCFSNSVSIWIWMGSVKKGGSP